jgi:hypothetical protein
MNTESTPSTQSAPVPAKFSIAEGFAVYPRFQVPEGVANTIGLTALLLVEGESETVLAISLPEVLTGYVRSNVHARTSAVTHVAFRACDDTAANHEEAFRLKRKYDERFNGIAPHGSSVLPRS